MSNCTGCYHERGNKPDLACLECEICIRNPKYPTMKMPNIKEIDGIGLTVPQDMYISKDRARFEEKRFLKKLQRTMLDILQKREDLERKHPATYKRKPWSWYWDYVHQASK